WWFKKVSSKAVFGSREGAVLHRGDVAFDRFGHARRAVHEVAYEARLAARVDIEHVVQHQHLSVALDPRTDADGRNGECARHFARQLCGNRFEHHDARTGFFHGAGVVEHLLCSVSAALDLVTAERMHRLRRETDVAANGDAAIYQEADG